MNIQVFSQRYLPTAIAEEIEDVRMELKDIQTMANTDERRTRIDQSLVEQLFIFRIQSASGFIQND